MRVLIAVPTLDVGAADEGAADLAVMLARAGHIPVVVSAGGRLEAELARAGIECIRRDMASRNPLTTARNAAFLLALIRRRGIAAVHAHGRAAAWSAFAAARGAGVPFLTSWYKGFREQNLFKHGYNSVMARGDRVVAVSEQIADLIVERHCTPRARIAVIPPAVDFDLFDPGALTAERIEKMRAAWGVPAGTEVVLVAGRMLRRKGHHVVVRAAERLKTMGRQDVLFVFAGEDQGRSRYTGELWDLVLSTGTADIVRMAGPTDDMPAAYAAADVVVSAAVQPEGLQRSILESLAMARPVLVSDLAAGTDIVLTPPAVPEDRMTGLRFAAGDADDLAFALMRLFAMAEPERSAIGRRGREWVLARCNRSRVAEEMLAAYAAVLAPRKRF
ncbi:glycosyltransferase [Xanthobacteraceae bacterium Astr-EGSB]|uniref:glycosyltransferase n=1 Tax=Astrobacterium formosum TaxID=3069710 RepID=UPI0027B3368A|nr:glycosyltransferase [Xanthobacteraceae bacterium Astr-EGSB]